jgi:excisionase family DNA binding protein
MAQNNHTHAAKPSRADSTGRDIMGVEEAAEYLGISKLSMYKLIRDKSMDIPVKRLAGAFKISRRQLLDWFEAL